jgi:hypothetical protein
MRVHDAITARYHCLNITLSTIDVYQCNSASYTIFLIHTKKRPNAYQNGDSPASIPQHEFEGFYFSYNGVSINDFSRRIGMKIWQYQLDAYYKKRRQWDSQVLTTIHWKALGQWLDSLKMLRKIRAMKFIHQRQYVKYQELKFKELNGEVDASGGKCPYGCHAVEHHANFYITHKLLQWNIGRYAATY